MNIIRVDTIELRQSGAEFTKISGDMEYTSRRLANIGLQLAKQEFTGLSDIINIITGAANSLDEVSTETKSLGRQCERISDVYDNTERDVLNMVKSLPVFSIFNNKSNNTAVLNQALAYQIFSEPVIFANSGVYGEAWVIKRAVDELRKEFADE